MKAEKIDYERLRQLEQDLKDYGEEIKQAAVQMRSVTDQAHGGLKDSFSLATLQKMETTLEQLQQAGERLVDDMDSAELVIRRKMEQQKEQSKKGPDGEAPDREAPDGPKETATN